MYKRQVKGLYGGDGDCKFGCLGYGDCVSVCAFDAIHVVDGVALVDREKCTGCGACAKACPNAIISIIQEHKRKAVVLCQNKDKGAQTRKDVYKRQRGHSSAASSILFYAFGEGEKAAGQAR